MKASLPAALLATMLSQPQTAGIAAAEEPSGDTLALQFLDPPASARPRVWWHWMNGNITQEGIRKDLEWMQRVGIGGVQNFDAAMVTPQIVEQRLAYMSPAWQDAFRYAATLAEQLGLELAIAGSPGWSETGGPWVTPAEAMKKLVWSETEIPGGRLFKGHLPPPPAVTGPFQGLGLHDELAALEGRTVSTPPTYYADVAVFAYPVVSGQLPLPSAASTPGGPLDANALSDDSLSRATEVPRGTPDAPGIVTLRYPHAVTIRSATLFIPGATSLFSDAELAPVLEARHATAWTPLGTFTLAAVPTTLSFQAVTADEFRLVLRPNPAPPRASLGPPAPGVEMAGSFGSSAPATALRIAEFRLMSEPRVDHFEAKAGFSVARDYYALPAAAPGAGVGIPTHEVFDLTVRMAPDGRLAWKPPAGRWRIVRLGYSLLGTTNHPASAEATGLEVDKYDGGAVGRYLDAYLGRFRDALGQDLFGAKGLRALVTDSIETGPSNWTPAMLAQFTHLRGYDPRPWLPVLAGTVIGSRVESDAFLYDFRRTLADLIASEHYGRIAEIAHADGLTVYGEALEELRPSLGDDMAMRSHTDIPMAAMWTFDRDGKPRPSLLADIKGAASVAHLYGQNLVAAESMTSAMHPWGDSPADLKHVIDLEFAMGVNRPVIHSSVHQPVDDKIPGLSLAIFGQYFNRHETWAEMARPWIDYMARSSFLLQQGRNVADVAYFYGEEAPLTSLYGDQPLADGPIGHAFDFVDGDALLHRLSVDQGEFVAPGGARYQVLYLGGSAHHMTVPMLHRLHALVDAGATVVGLPPLASPSLADNRAEFNGSVARLWPGPAEARIGQGRVINSAALTPALARLGVMPDFATPGLPADGQVRFVHRQLAAGDLYFICNGRNRVEHVDAHFRVTGKPPEVWRAEDGSRAAVSYRLEPGQTIVPLDLGPEEALFVVFRTPAPGDGTGRASRPGAALADLSTDWNVSFQSGGATPASTHLERLLPLNENADAGTRYFSGIATYTRTFVAPRGLRHGAPLWLDLGQVGDLAEVSVNGQRVGAAWHAPFRLDIGSAVRPGPNTLEVRVADLWVNRLIGDAQPGAQKTTFTALPTYRADAPLRPSGLIGPVRLQRGEP